MASTLDTYASLTSAGIRSVPTTPVEPRVMAFSNGDNVVENDALADAYALKEEEDDDIGLVDLSTDMVPTFFESGQLMWEISAQTEADHEQPTLMRPEIVLTDSSFSLSGFQEDNRHDKEGNNTARERRSLLDSHQEKPGDVDNMDARTAVLSGQHCFELLTDENDPLCSSSAQQHASVECQATEVTLDDASRPLLDGERLASDIATIHAAVHPLEAAAADCLMHQQHHRLAAEHGSDRKTSDRTEDPSPHSLQMDPQQQQQQHHHHQAQQQQDLRDHEESYVGQSGNEERRNKESFKKLGIGHLRQTSNDAVLMDTLPSFKAAVSPNVCKGKEAFDIADSASEIFRTQDPRFVIGNVYEVSQEKESEQMKPPKLTALSLQPRIEKQDSALHCHPDRYSFSPEPSPRIHTPGCSLKDVLSSAMSKINDVVYSCTHTKQRRREREILKKLQARSRGSLTPNASSSCGAYRRRNTLIRQKMEGMIDNESKTRSSNKCSKAHRPSSPSRSKKKVHGEIKSPSRA